MVKCYLIENGKSKNNPLNLPAIPHRGDLVTSVDYKDPQYLVHRVEFPIGSDSIYLHVQKFPNQITAINAIKGFRNQRGWLDF